MAHWLASQIGVPSPAGQLLPQAPQLAGSLPTSTQVPEQSSSPDWQVYPQAPSAQVGSACFGAVQTFPHSLQWVGSVSVSTQAPEQAVNPSSQLSVHLPSTHKASPCAGEGQGTGQLTGVPELLDSELVVVDEPPPLFWPEEGSPPAPEPVPATPPCVPALAVAPAFPVPALAVAPPPP